MLNKSLNIKAGQLVRVDKENYKSHDHHKVIWSIVESAFGGLNALDPIYETIKGFPGHIKLDRIIDNLHKDILYYVFVLQGKPCGCFALEALDHNQYKLSNLAVLPDYWQVGIGSLLLEKAEGLVMDQGGSLMKLGLVEQNDKLYKWYQEKGYIKIGKKRGIVFMEKHVAYWMTVNNFSKPINKANNSCQSCGMWQPKCICRETEAIRMSCRMILLTHENELHRLTNTGRMIKRTFPQDTHVIAWKRDRVSPLLKTLLADDRQDYLVFPQGFVGNSVIEFKAIDKGASFIIIDSTWDEAKKIIRKSPYLSHLPLVSFKEVGKSIYKLRRNQEAEGLCTAEVGLELLNHLDLKKEAHLLKSNFTRFIKGFEASRQGGGADE